MLPLPGRSATRLAPARRHCEGPGCGTTTCAGLNNSAADVVPCIVDQLRERPVTSISDATRVVSRR